MRRRLTFGLFGVGIALGALAAAAVAWWRPGEPVAASRAVPEPPAPIAASEPPAPIASAGSSAPAPGLSALPSLPEPPSPDWRHSGEQEDEGRIARLPDVIDYPLFEKYEGRVDSGIPHVIVAAWDDGAEDGALGRRRALIAVVESRVPDADLERLVRDLRDSHRDAEHLLVRVFDDERAAFQPSWTDQGAMRRDHLVAELRRTGASGRERLVVRERVIKP